MIQCVLFVSFCTSAICGVYAMLQHKSYDDPFQAVVNNKCSILDLEMKFQAVVTDFEETALRAVAGLCGCDVNPKGSFTI